MISGGEIKLVGYILHLRFFFSQPYKAETMESRRGRPWPTYELCAEEYNSHYDVGKDIHMHLNIVVLHLGAWEWRPRDRFVIKAFAGLLLKPENSQELVFSRIGIVKLQVRISEKHWHSYSWHNGVERRIVETWKKETITIV